MSQKLKICKCISYACLTWLANSGSIELCEIIYQLNFIYLCISYFLSTNVQSYQRNICETKQTLWHVTCLASHFEKGLISHLTLRYDKHETSVKNFSYWLKCLLKFKLRKMLRMFCEFLFTQFFLLGHFACCFT